MSRSTPHSTPRHDSITIGDGLRAVLVLLTIALAWSATAPTEATAAARCNPITRWCATTATWYGPGFYGNRFACSHRRDVPNRYSERHTRGVAHMTLPCGSRVTVCRARRCVRVRVIDTGAFNPRHLDLTARTARDLIGCRSCRPYTQRITWRRGWRAAR